MEKEIKELTRYEIEERIGELEQTYAELLADQADAKTLHNIWKEIQLLQGELQARSN